MPPVPRPFPRFIAAIKRPEWREFLEGYGKGLER